MSFDIIEQFSATTGHRDKTAATMEVFAVCTEVFGEVRDSLCEQSNLHFRRARIGFVCFKIGDDR